MQVVTAGRVAVAAAAKGNGLAETPEATTTFPGGGGGGKVVENHIIFSSFPFFLLIKYSRTIHHGS